MSTMLMVYFRVRRKRCAQEVAQALEAAGACVVVERDLEGERYPWFVSAWAPPPPGGAAEARPFFTSLARRHGAVFGCWEEREGGRP